MTSLLTEDVLVRGNTDLMYVSLVTTPAVGWGARSRLARTLTEGLHRAGIVSGRAHAGSEGIFVTATWRTDPRAVDELVSRLQKWRNMFDDNMIAPASPPTSPAELITALTFDAHDETDPTEGELTSILTTLSFDVVVGGGDCESALRSARDRICDAANTAVENGVKPKRESGRRTPRRPDVPTRRWAQVPVRSSWVRWYRFIDPPTDPGERLARSLVNVAFGGVYGSHLVDCVRRQRGLSYSPQSTLLQRDGRHLLVVDVQTTRGDENACDDAIRTALDQFAHRKLTRHRMVDAARYLIGRTIVDRDSLQSAVDERAAIYEGSLDSALDTTGSPEDLVARAGADTLTRTVETLYAPDGFGAVVLSPDRSNGKWVEL